MIEFGVDKGILVKIRGDDIAAGGQMLPTADPGQPPASCPPWWILLISAKCGSPTGSSEALAE